MKELSLLDHNITRLLSYNSISMHGGKSEQTATFPQTERSFHLARDYLRTCRTYLLRNLYTKKIHGLQHMERLQKYFFQ